jgi:hypothetical protein
MKGFIRALILLAVCVGALPVGTIAQEAPTNYLITVVTYPQLRGSECDDPYPTGDTQPVSVQYKERGISGVYSVGTELRVSGKPANPPCATGTHVRLLGEGGQSSVGDGYGGADG